MHVLYKCVDANMTREVSCKIRNNRAFVIQCKRKGLKCSEVLKWSECSGLKNCKKEKREKKNEENVVRGCSISGVSCWVKKGK